MLRKCLKYDLKSIFRIWLLLAATILILSPIAGLLLRSFLLRLDDMIFPWEIFLLMGGCFLLWAFALVIMVLVYIRYYTNFFKDEGYLTFTLPVSRSTLFLSKVLTATIYDAATVAVILTSIATALAIAPDLSQENFTLLGSLLTLFGLLLGEFVSSVSFGSVVIIVVIVFEVLLLLFLSSFTKTLFYYFAITLGTSISKKHPIIMTIVLIYAANSILPTLMYACIYGLVFGAGAAMKLYPAAFTGGSLIALVILILLIGCIIVTVINLILCFASLGKLERKLNLA